MKARSTSKMLTKSKFVEKGLMLKIDKQNSTLSCPSNHLKPTQTLSETRMQTIGTLEECSW